MQIEKHIKIVPTPTGAVVFFAGQVCLSVNEHSGRYTWSISPVFAKLTTGISTCFEVPMASWEGQETLAEAIADGLTRLDEMHAFYGVIDMPEDTYVEAHLDESTDYSGVEADVKRTGKSHEKLAAEHRAYAKQMRAIGKDGLAVRSEMLASDHEKAYLKASKKTNESVEAEDLLAESFVVRQVGQSRNHPARIMISADAVIKRAREMAKEAGEKASSKFIKLAHSEIASNMKAESVEELDEGSVSKEKQKTPFRNINSPEYKAAGQKQKEQMATDAAAKPGKALLSRIKSEEFVQYEDALPAAFQSIKEDCRAEALSMSDSLLEAQQLANELFEDIIEEYLDTLFEVTHQELLDGAQKAYVEATRKGNGVMAKHYGQEILKHKANIAAIAARAKRLKLKEEVEELDEARLAQPLKGHTYHKKSEAELNYIIKDAGLAARANKGGSAEGKYLDQMNDASTVLYYRKNGGKQVHEELDEGAILDAEKKIKEHDAKDTSSMSAPDLFSHKLARKRLMAARTTAQRNYNKKINNESVEDLDEAALSGDAYWKAKEAESKEEFLKAQRKALGLPEPVKRGRGKPTLIDRDLLKTRAHSNVEAGKRPTAGFDRNEKIHFVRHLKNHPDFADKHVSQAGRPTGTTKVAKQQQELAKKKQDTAFSMWAGLGKR